MMDENRLSNDNGVKHNQMMALSIDDNKPKVSDAAAADTPNNNENETIGTGTGAANDDPLARLASSSSSESARRVHRALTTDGYCVVPDVLEASECVAAVRLVHDFVSDVGLDVTASSRRPTCGHGAGFVLGALREDLAHRVYAPLWNTTALHASKEGFTVETETTSRPSSDDDEPGTVNDDDDDRSASSSPAFVMIRSMIALNESISDGDDGDVDCCFQCWPGCFGKKCPSQSSSPRRVALQQGDVLLWRSDLAWRPVHENNNHRILSYCTMQPASFTPHHVWDEDKMEAYKQRRTGHYPPHVETWYNDKHHAALSSCRQYFRTSPPLVTIRQAELYGLLPYNTSSSRQQDLERAVIRGVRFVDRPQQSIRTDAAASTNRPDTTARLELLRAPTTLDAEMGGADKWLGGMASPCGTYVYGVPGTARRVLRITVADGRMDCIGPALGGRFKWLRGVGVPPETGGGSSYPAGCCLALPCNQASILKINPATHDVYAFGQAVLQRCGATNWLYHGGNLAPSNGWVYAIPANAERVLKFHPFTDEVQLIGPRFPGKAKWYGGIMGSDGCIWGIPHNHSHVLRIDPRTDQVTLLGQGRSDEDRQPLPDGRWKWHGGLRAGDKIIGFPNNSDSVLVINCSDQHVYTIGDASILKSGRHRIPQDNRYKYLGGALTQDGRFAFLFPCDAERVLRVNCEEDQLSLVGPLLLEGENKFQNGFVGRDGALYGIPQRSCGVLRIVPRSDPEGEDHVDLMDCGEALVGVKDKFEGGVLGADGCIYCIPLRGKTFGTLFVNVFCELVDITKLTTVHSLQQKHA